MVIQTKQFIIFEGTEEEFHEAFVRALNKHCGAYMMPLFIDPLNPTDFSDNLRKRAYWENDIKKNRALYDKLVTKIILELKGKPVPQRD